VSRLSRRLQWLLLAAAPALAGPDGGAPKGSAQRDACSLVSPAEVAQTLGYPEARVDPENSGHHAYLPLDLCNYVVKDNDPRGVMIKVHPASDPSSAFSAARLDAESDRKRVPEPIAGLGDEAQFQSYAVPPGGWVSFRKGNVGVSLQSSASKEALIALARRVASRL